MTNIERRDAEMAYISDESVFEEQKECRKILQKVTCSHHLIIDFEVGASCSMALLSQVSTGYPRVSRDCFLPGYGHFITLSGYGRISFFCFLLCSQHSPRFLSDVDRCVFVSVHDVATVAAINPLR